MPAILEDPNAPHHVGPPLPANAQSTLQPRTVILRDHVTVATIIPVLPGAGSLPLGLVAVLHEEFNREIERGDTYPMEALLTLEAFRSYWFGTFAAVMVLGNETALREGRDWVNECLGAFYTKPNYPGACAVGVWEGVGVGVGLLRRRKRRGMKNLPTDIAQAGVTMYATAASSSVTTPAQKASGSFSEKPI